MYCLKSGLKGKLSWILSKPRLIWSADTDRRLSRIRCDVSAYCCLTCSDENYYFYRLWSRKRTLGVIYDYHILSETDCFSALVSFQTVHFIFSGSIIPNSTVWVGITAGHQIRASILHINACHTMHLRAHCKNRFIHLVVILRKICEYERQKQKPPVSYNPRRVGAGKWPDRREQIHRLLSQLTKVTKPFNFPALLPCQTLKQWVSSKSWTLISSEATTRDGNAQKSAARHPAG